VFFCVAGFNGGPALFLVLESNSYFYSMTLGRTLSCCFIASLLLTGCDIGKREKKKEPIKDHILRTYSKDKKLVSEIPMKDKKRHGLAKTYYANGKVNLEIEYVEDRKEGKSRRYYETGLLFQETDYKNNQIHGVQKKFGSDGLQSEARYEFGNPCTGLEEYSRGKKRTSYPGIVIRAVDRIQIDGSYTLKLSLTDGASRTRFYLGALTQSGCLHNALLPIPAGSGPNTAEHKYVLNPGEFYMEELNFIAEVTTRAGNVYLTQKKFPLSIEN
jgi:hypothetical protein